MSSGEKRIYELQITYFFIAELVSIYKVAYQNEQSENGGMASLFQGHR